MTNRTHPDSGRTTVGIVEMLQDRVAELEAQLEAIGAGGVSGPLVGRNPEGITRDDTVHGESYFTAADMATASAQGFRDGAASVAANAGSEPVARVNDDGFIVEIGDLLIAPGQKLYTHPYPLGGMVGGCNGGSND